MKNVKLLKWLQNTINHFTMIPPRPNPWKSTPVGPLKPVKPNLHLLSPEEKRKKIEELAYWYWKWDGCKHGHDVEHWIAAEKAVDTLEACKECSIGG